MAKNQGFVNIGALVNPASGISSALADLSDMYGRRSSEELKAAENEAAKAESARRFNLQQSESVKEQSHKDKSRAAKGVTNEWIAGITQGNLKPFTEKDYSTEMQKYFSKTRQGIDDEESAYRNYLTKGDDTSLTAAGAAMASNLGRGLDKVDRDKLISDRLGNLKALKAQLDSSDPADRKDLINKAMYEALGGKRASIDQAVASGDSLIKKQKLAAIMRRMPEETKAYGDYDRLYNTISKTLYGPTEKSLIDKERQEVDRYNEAQKAKYVRDSNAYIKSVKSKDTDYGKLTKLLKEDYGWFDNDDKEDIINVMLSRGISPSSIEFAIAQASDENWFGKSLPSANSPEMLGLMADAEARQKKQNIAAGMRYDDKGNLIGSVRPSGYSPRTTRNLAELQKELLRGKYSSTDFNSTIKVAQKWKDKVLGTTDSKEVVTETLPEVVPDTATKNIVLDRSKLLPSVGGAPDSSMLSGGRFNPTIADISRAVEENSSKAVRSPEKVSLGSLDTSTTRVPSTGITSTGRIAEGAGRLSNYVRKTIEDVNRRKLKEFEATDDPVQIAARASRGGTYPSFSSEVSKLIDRLPDKLKASNKSSAYERKMEAAKTDGYAKRRLPKKGKNATDHLIDLLNIGNTGPRTPEENLAIEKAQERISDVRSTAGSTPERMNRLDRLINANTEVGSTKIVGGKPSDAKKLVESVDDTIDTSSPEYKYDSVNELPKKSREAYIRALNRLKPKDGSIMDAEDYKEVTEAALKGLLDPAT